MGSAHGWRAQLNDEGSRIAVHASPFGTVLFDLAEDKPLPTFLVAGNDVPTIRAFRVPADTLPHELAALAC